MTKEKSIAEKVNARHWPDPNDVANEKYKRSIHDSRRLSDGSQTSTDSEKDSALPQRQSIVNNSVSMYSASRKIRKLPDSSQTSIGSEYSEFSPLLPKANNNRL